MAVYVFIGGKANKEIMTNKIERHALCLINKSRPKVLYCPYAAVNNMEKSILRFHNMMMGIDCDIYDMSIDDIDRFDELLNEADCLYIGGGYSDDLVELFIKNGLDKILRKYMNSNKIFIGSSAGAMLFTACSMGDKYVYNDNFHSYNYKMVKCLGLFNMIICPHYQNEDLIIFNDEIKNYDIDAFGIEEDTALIINDNQYYVIKEDLRRSLYYFDKNTKIMKSLYEGEVYEKIGGFRV